MTLAQISAVEQIMRLAITGQKNVDGLVGYYRGIIDNYNDERAEWALNYEQLKDSANNKHTLQNQLDYSRHNINQSEAELNTIKAALAKQRQFYFEALEQSQALKEKCELHRQKYRDMVALCKPISVGKRKTNQSRENSRSQNQSNMSQSSHGEPHSNTQLELELINMTKDHNQKKAQLTQDIDLMKQQLQDLLSEHGQRSQLCSKDYKQALENLATVQGKIMHLTAQYFKLRMENYESERRLQEENQILRLKTVALAKKLQLLRSQHEGEFKTVEKEVKTRNKNFRQKYDSQLKQKEEHLTILKEQHTRINDIYLLKLTKLEDELRNTNQRQKILEEKYRSQSNSLKGQIRILKSRLQKPGVRQMRAQLADQSESEESSVTLSMGELEKINKQVKELQKRV